MQRSSVYHSFGSTGIDIIFTYWDGKIIDLMISVDVVYGDGTVSDQFVGYEVFESGQPWPPHLF